MPEPKARESFEKWGKGSGSGAETQTAKPVEVGAAPGAVDPYTQYLAKQQAVQQPNPNPQGAETLDQSEHRQLVTLGQQLYTKKEFDKAAKFFEKAQIANPTAITAFMAAQAHEQAGNTPNAQAQYLAALGLANTTDHGLTSPQIQHARSMADQKALRKADMQAHNERAVKEAIRNMAMKLVQEQRMDPDEAVRFATTHIYDQLAL